MIELSRRGLVLASRTHREAVIRAEMELGLRWDEYSVVTELKHVMGRRDFHYLLMGGRAEVFDACVHRGQPVTIPEIKEAVRLKRA